MKNRIHIIFIILGIALMSVPIIFDLHDRAQAEKYIERLEDGTESERQETKTKNKKKKKQKGNKEKASEELPVEAIGIIEIPDLDIRYPIFEGTGETQLSAGIGHLPESAGLLAKGNCVLAGHNGSRQGKFFTELSSIGIGSEVMITNKDKVTHTYKVEEIGIVGPYDESVRKESKEECLTLFTCANHGTQRFYCRCKYINEEDE